MSPKKVILISVGLVAIGFLFVWGFRHPTKEYQVPINVPPPPTVATVVTNVLTNAPPIVQQHSKIKTRFSEFTDAEKSAFAENFKKRYKPALSNWCKAYETRVPFSAEAVTPEKFIERIGKNAAYNEFIFVVDGITLGIQDTQGSARVDYLNDPQQTQKMAAQPNGTDAPIVATPVARNEVAAMLAADNGTRFSANEIRMIPGGFSGGLNGGVLVHVGGDPENAASWKYDLVFGADGKLAYYLKGR